MKIVFYIFIIVVLLAAIKNIALSVYKNSQEKGIIATYNSELKEQKENNKFLKEQLSYVQSQKFIEEEARNKLGLVQSGEMIVIAPISDKRNAVSTNYVDSLPNWKQWLKLFE